jgi:hypothetical protein
VLSEASGSGLGRSPTGDRLTVDLTFNVGFEETEQTLAWE